MTKAEWKYIGNLIDEITSAEAEMIRVALKHEKLELEQREIDNYKIMRATVETLFSEYNQMDQAEPGKCLADLMLKTHQEEAMKSGNEIKLQHNAFILRYIIGKTLEIKEICKQLDIKISICQKYINAVFDDFMIYLYGLDGIKPPIYWR